MEVGAPDPAVSIGHPGATGQISTLYRTDHRMKIEVTYRQDFTEVAAPEAARRWTIDVLTDPDEFATTLNRLMDDALTRGHEITRVVIDRPKLQAV